MRENFKILKVYYIFLNEGFYYGEGKLVKCVGIFVFKIKFLDWEIFFVFCLN